MKMISENLGRIIAALAAIALLVACVTGFRTDIGDFFLNVTSKQQSIGNKVLDSMNGFNVSMDGSGGSGAGGSGGPSVIQLATPSISIDGSILTITPVENATSYEVYSGDELLTTTAETTVELSTYLSNPGSYIVRVRAIGSDAYKPSGYAQKDHAVELAPGLYQTGTNYGTLLKSWDTLIEEGIITADGKVVSGMKNSLAGDLVISDDITAIVDSSYYQCSSLTGVIIPEGVTSIGSSSFYRCTSLSNITIPKSVTSIGEKAFQDCKSFTSIEIPANVSSIANYTFSGCTGLSSIEIPAGVTTIGKNAFYQCQSLTSIEIPAGVTVIGASAFYDCKGLTSIEIPASVTTIGSDAFTRCSGLVSISVDFENARYHSSGDCIIETAYKSVIVGCKSSIIPSDGSVTTIDTNAFSGCTGLTNIEIPASVDTIGSNAFSGCTGLTSIEIPASVDMIGNYVFQGCTGLTSVTIPEGVSSIGAKVFSGCTSLTSIEIPAGVNSISNSAFNGCTSLTNISFEGTVAQWNSIQKDFGWNNNCGQITVTCTGDENGDGAGTVIVPAYGS